MCTLYVVVVYGTATDCWRPSDAAANRRQRTPAERGLLAAACCSLGCVLVVGAEKHQTKSGTRKEGEAASHHQRACTSM